MPRYPSLARVFAYARARRICSNLTARALVNNGLVSPIIMFFVWLGLIKHFFDCGWLKAFAIAIVAIIMFIIIDAILAFIGIGIIALSLAGL